MEDEETPNYYEARMDRIFKSSLFSHRTLRTLFDMWSTEWNMTNYNQKFAMLTRILESGECLEILIPEYQQRYREQNRHDIANCVEDAVAQLLQYKILGPQRANEPEKS